MQDRALEKIAISGRCIEFKQLTENPSLCLNQNEYAVGVLLKQRASRVIKYSNSDACRQLSLRQSKPAVGSGRLGK
jgi:hypothetical protein